MSSLKNMNDFEKIELFLNYFKNNRTRLWVSEQVVNFAGSCFNKKLYKLLPIISEQYPISKENNDTYNIIIENINNGQVGVGLSYLKNVPDNIQNSIIKAFLNNEITDFNPISHKNFIRNIFNNFNVSSEKIKDLFYDSFYQCTEILHEFSPSINNISPYKQFVSDTICELYINELNNEKSFIWSKSIDNTMPFACISNPNTIKYVLDNMPRNIEVAEKVSTKLINSISLTEEQKNQLFDEYGYNLSEPLINSTPYISDTLYKSAINGLDQLNKEKSTEYYNRINQFLENAIVNNIFTEASQIDLVNRLIKKEKEDKYIPNNFLLLFAENTNSSQVLHLIFKAIKNIDKQNDVQNTVIRNPVVSNEDLKEHVDLYFNKIYEYAIKRKGKAVPYSWIKEIIYVSKHLAFTDAQYQLLIDAGVYEPLIENSQTPTEYLNEALNNLKKALKEHNSYNTLYDLEQALLHSKLLSKNCCSQEQLDFAFTYLNQAKLCYQNSPIKSSMVSYQTNIKLLQDKKFANAFYNAVKYTSMELKKIGYEFEEGNVKDFLSTFKKNIYDDTNGMHTGKSDMELQQEIDKNVFDFSESINMNEGLVKLMDYAENHYKLINEISKRPTLKNKLLL
jgi:hypothetical protein